MIIAISAACVAVASWIRRLRTRRAKAAAGSAGPGSTEATVGE
ncbi:hypothetical protein ACGFY7_02420 [Streptomyces prunicolor]